MDIFEVFKSAVIDIISTIVPANFKGLHEILHFLKRLKIYEKEFTIDMKALVKYIEILLGK